MASNPPPLPPGFQLERAPASAPPLPPGFELEARPAPSAEEYRSAQAELMPRAQAEPVQDAAAAAQGGGALSGLSELIAGAGRETRATKELPELSGILADSGAGNVEQLKAAFGALTSTNPEELANTIVAAAPQVIGKQYDEKGNIILTNNKTGQRVLANRPGLSGLDVLQALGLGAAFTPAGRLATIPAMAAGAAGTQAAIETGQALSGGEFDEGDVLASGVLAAVLPAVTQTIRTGLAKLRAPAPQPAAVAPPLAAAIPEQAVTPPAASTADDVTAAARKAAAGGVGSGRAAQVLASEAAPDAEALAAARRLGIEDYLQPDHITTNQAYRELAQAVKSIPGSEARAQEIAGLEQIAKRADDIVTEAGGMRDLSQLSDEVRGSLSAAQQQLDEAAEKLYGELRTAIDPKTKVSADNVLNLIKSRADELGGIQNLTKMEQKVLAKLTPKVVGQGEGFVAKQKPTYALLDDVRRTDVGAALKNQGEFKDTESAVVKRLYSALSDDQAAAAAAAGKGEVFEAAKNAVKQRKAIEDDMVSLYGKELSQSLVGKLGTATAALSKGDADRFIALLKSVPEDQRAKVAASSLIQGFGKSAKDGLLNFNSFTKWYRDLKTNTKAYNALASNLPKGTIQQLDDLYKVSKGISDASRERITTGRLGVIRDQLSEADGVLGSLYSLAKRSAKGAASEAITTPLGMPGAGVSAAVASALTKGKSGPVQAVDRLISSPEFIDMTRRGVTEEAAKKVAKSKAWGAFWRSLPDDLQKEIDPNAPERWIMTAAQSVRATAPEQEQE